MFNVYGYEEHRGFNWGTFISGVLMVIVGLLVLRHPDKSLHAFVLLFGIISIGQGIAWIAAFVGLHRTFGRAWTTLVSGIIDILVGVMFLADYEVGGITLGILFSVWFLIDSITGLVVSWSLRGLSTPFFIFDLLMSIFGLIIAFMLLLHPVVAIASLIYLVAFWLIVFGVRQIILAWARR
ncbi:HdeD family acid-resistance protein [Lactobacillus corticis]|uniref:Membrane protein n=1 Tax=Lactobacillus corticis TaxID=2201249 RepID=A0A916QGZ8_9LACO|nr:DUF308 domain-containing protein [Lactobacillus corticis]GFZ27185.1 membrane protein [Lactobacillus corticis]